MNLEERLQKVIVLRNKLKNDLQIPDFHYINDLKEPMNEFVKTGRSWSGSINIDNNYVMIVNLNQKEPNITIRRIRT